MTRILALLIVCVLLQQGAWFEVRELWAQTPDSTQALKYEEGWKAGQIAAKEEGYKRPVLEGVFLGYLSGIRGTVVLAGLTQGNHADGARIIEHKAHIQGLVYMEGFKQGFKETSKRTRTTGRLIGGIAGALVTLYLLDGHIPTIEYHW